MSEPFWKIHMYPYKGSFHRQMFAIITNKQWILQKGGLSHLDLILRVDVDVPGESFGRL